MENYYKSAAVCEFSTGDSSHEDCSIVLTMM
jgi:hypothetical protein